MYGSSETIEEIFEIIRKRVRKKEEEIHSEEFTVVMPKFFLWLFVVTFILMSAIVSVCVIEGSEIDLTIISLLIFDIMVLVGIISYYTNRLFVRGSDFIYRNFFGKKSVIPYNAVKKVCIYKGNVKIKTDIKNITIDQCSFGLHPFIRRMRKNGVNIEDCEAEV